MTNTANTATAPATFPAGTKVRVTRGTYKGRESVVHSVVGATHIVAGIPTYLKATSLKAI